MTERKTFVLTDVFNDVTDIISVTPEQERFLFWLFDHDWLGADTEISTVDEKTKKI